MPLRPHEDRLVCDAGLVPHSQKAWPRGHVFQSMGMKKVRSFPAYDRFENAMIHRESRHQEWKKQEGTSDSKEQISRWHI